MKSNSVFTHSIREVIVVLAVFTFVVGATCSVLFLKWSHDRYIQQAASDTFMHEVAKQSESNATISTSQETTKVSASDSEASFDLVSEDMIPAAYVGADIPLDFESIQNEASLASSRTSRRRSRVIKTPVPVVVATTTSSVTTPTVTTSTPTVTQPVLQVKSTTLPVGLAVGDTLTGLSPAELNDQLDTMVKLGITWIRLDFDWSWVQPKADRKIEWELLDRVVTAAHARGLKLLPIIVYTPVWARRADCVESPRCQPANPADYADFAKQMVIRYVPYGIHQWEIWNEQNMHGSWLPAADATSYTKLLVAASRAIKSVDPNAIIVTGGLGPSATGGGDIAPVEYVIKLYDAGAKDYFDALGFHPYSYPALPSDNQKWNAWQQMYLTSTNVRSIMVAHGDSAKKIWITEYGAPTGGPGAAAPARDSYKTSSYTHVTEEYQSAMLEDALSQLKTVDWAGPFFWYSYKDLGTSQATIENFFGLLRKDGTYKPVYSVLDKLLH